jgi:hypothetical protein
MTTDEATIFGKRAPKVIVSKIQPSANAQQQQQQPILRN